jgi:hypothetical protein
LINFTAHLYIASFNTNLFLHFHNRLLKTLKKLHPAPQDATKPERKMHALMIARLAYDVQRRQGVDVKSTGEFVELASSYRLRLGLDELPIDVPTSAPKSKLMLEIMQRMVFTASYRLNRIREEITQSVFLICPVTTGLVPQFISIDWNVAKDMCGLKDGSCVRAQNRRSLHRRAAKLRSTELRKQRGMTSTNRDSLRNIAISRS